MYVLDKPGVSDLALDHARAPSLGNSIVVQTGLLPHEVASNELLLHE
jgi:hypothetical protein